MLGLESIEYPVADGGNRSGDKRSPQHIGNNYNERPIFESGVVGKVVGGVGNESKERARENRVYDRRLLKSGECRKHKDTHDEKKIKHSSGGKVHGSGQKVSNVFLVEGLCDESEPHKVNCEKGDKHREIGEYSVRECHRGMKKWVTLFIVPAFRFGVFGAIRILWDHVF